MFKDFIPQFLKRDKEHQTPPVLDILSMSDDEAVQFYRNRSRNMLGFKIKASREEILETVNRDREVMRRSIGKET